MAVSPKTVAILVSNPALSSLLGMTLAAVPSLRVRPFESQQALATYMKLAPVDLVVADYDSDTARADTLARELRAMPLIEKRDFQIVALASSITGDTRAISKAAGIDEVIVKPMSPKYLLERVLACVRRGGTLRKSPVVTRRPLVAYGDNVVPLFGPRLLPQG